eukprot:TRINITY_DN104321_c0_g1_i1.p1 TRINITY_DN104321_c0_g1~~TRINITY_DN104321_c0_g1_i1.p1  ORF type:complete len:879 (-),score=173.23 TRINITY_DN104321_c0_g1_i1:34-2391(-)
MVEKTDAVRQAAFAYTGAESLPIDTLEELLPLSARLPGRSRSVALQRIRFVLDPIRSTLAQELVSSLRRSGRWPLEPEKTVTEGAGPTDRNRALGLCMSLGRVEKVAKTMGEMRASQESTKTKGNHDSDDAISWACQALASLLVARFRYHFCRPESDLCRMDKPEWAFRYLMDLVKDHMAELQRWLNDFFGSEARSDAEGGGELLTGLVIALAQEAKLFVRVRLPPLAADAEARASLLQTLQHLVRLHGDMLAAGGPQAAKVLFADFDSNRLLDPQGKESGSDPGHSSGPAKSPGGRGLLGVRLVKGLSQLATRSEDDGSGVQLAADHTSPASRAASGFLDVWISVDAEFIADKLTRGLSEGGSAWRTKQLKHLPFVEQHAAAPESATAGSSPEVLEMSNLLVDLFERAAERVACLATEKARATYCAFVMAPALRQVLEAVKTRWNDLSDPLKEAQQSSLLVETLQEICFFFDDFPLAVHIATAADEATELRLLIVDRLASSFEEQAKSSWRSLRAESSVFSYLFAKPLADLARWLRPANFRAVGRLAAGKLGSYLLSQFLRQAPFANEVEAEVFAANCRDDLAGVLAMSLDLSDLSQLQPLWDGCQLMTLSSDTAMDTLKVLQRVMRLSPSLARGTDDSDEAPPSTEVLDRRRAEALARAGVENLSVADTLTLLRKRRDVATSGLSEQESSFSVLQDMLPAGAAQATLQLGAGTLQFGAGALQQLSEKAAARVPLPSASSGAQAALQAGSEKMIGLAGGAGRLVAGRLRSTLAAAAGGASTATK